MNENIIQPSNKLMLTRNINDFDFVLTAKESKELDALSNIDTLKLMEKAGDEIYKYIINRFSSKTTFLVVCGTGGNGGDGYVLARLLLENKYKVKILSIGEKFSKECEINKDKYLGEYANSLKDERFDVVIDAIFGIGLNREIVSPYKELFQEINELNSYKISIDIPSGINSDNGFVMGSFIKCNLCLAIQEYKLGHFLNFGRDSYDEIERIDIGLVAPDLNNYIISLKAHNYVPLFPTRDSNSNKGEYGRASLIAGSPELIGASLISLNGLEVLLCGSGYSTLCVPESLYPIYATKNFENTYVLLDSSKEGYLKFDKKNLDSLLNQDAIGIGNGLGISKEVYKTVEYLLENYNGNLVIDADAINSLSEFGVDILSNHIGNVFITPHIKEFSRLTGISVDEIKQNEVGFAKEFAKKYKVTILLKSNTTIITDGFGTYLNTNGSPALAKAGSGDLLMGILLGLLTKHDDLLLRASCASYILGKASELAVKDINENSVLVRDVTKYISKVIDLFK
ncbi:MAG: NAD(P)H-hydrate dehydratase [Bacilli bacterium]